MPSRRVERTAEFERSLTRLTNKHRVKTETVDEALAEYASKGPGKTSQRIGGLGEVEGSVYKDRLKLAGAGKRDGARIIYLCNDSLVLALFLYAKGDRKDVSPKEIRQALEAAAHWSQDLEGLPTVEDPMASS